ncbi:MULTISPECIES: hypothetical protein [Thiorhodovibrio]|uniref:hypothetical protein n=1 Tax=Thiorhodovibrio TaxID=61593 RepID=UPI0019121E70|nr:MULTISPECIES: hypothetical protein [Thiorhodovibrio]MBK5968105.1 hypothetical protein [Thiorhodovibrio winogradskyi]
MFAKLLLTLAVVVAAYTALRARRVKSADASPTQVKPSIPWQALRIGAWSIIAILLLASTWSVFHQWHRAREIVDVQVVNPATGGVDHYQARRGDIEGRGFRTLDGQQVRIAEFERLILSDLR